MGSLRVMAIVAAVSAFVQSVVWSILSLLAILTYACNFQPPSPSRTSPDDISYNLRYYIITYFMDPNCDSGSTQEPRRTVLGITSPSQVLLMVLLQFLFNICTAVVSLILIFMAPTCKARSLLCCLSLFLIFFVGVSVIDALTTVTFIKDRQAVDENGEVEVKLKLSNVLLFLSIIACRGVIFWILNVFLSTYLFIMICRGLTKECCSPPPTKIKATEQSSITNGILNNGFNRDDEDYPSYSAQSRWPALNRKPQKIAKVYLPSNNNSKPAKNQNVSSESEPGPKTEPQIRPPHSNHFAQTVDHSERKHYRDPPDNRSQYVDRSNNRHYAENRDLLNNRHPVSRQHTRASRQDAPVNNHQINSSQDRSTNRFPTENRPNSVAQTNSIHSDQHQIKREERGPTEKPHQGSDLVLERRSGTNNTRPGSLQEAILTVRPLRQVRPKLNQLENKY